MSVLIKTMTNLPEHCFDCPCHNEESGYCQADKEHRYCIDRSSWCPLVKISNAHYGRLIRFNDIRIVNAPIAPIFKGDKVHYEGVAFLSQILEIPPVEAIPVTAVEEMKRKIKELNEFSRDEIDEMYMQDVLKIIDECCGIIEADNTESEVNYGKWIPATENLPSDLGYDWVLAQIQEDNGYLWIPMVMEYRKAKDDWYSDISNLGWLKDHNGAFKVIRWTPLPAPYEPKESEEV